jgi:hypothetical protein
MATQPEKVAAPYREISREEAWALLDAATHRYLGISVDEFARRYNAGEYDDPDDDPVIMQLAFDLEFLQRNETATP